LKVLKMTIRKDRGTWLYLHHKLPRSESAVGGPLGEIDASIGCYRPRFSPRDSATAAL
jgi:hypothetical protein